MFPKFLFAILLSLSMMGCTTTGTTTIGNIASVVSIGTKVVENPVKDVNVYQVKQVYLATLKLAASYREYCWSKSYAAIMADPIMKPVCEGRRAAVRAIQSAQSKARRALDAAEKFVRENPSGNAVTFISAAWQAVTDFKNSVPALR